MGGIVGPINYMGAMPQVDIGQSILSGFQIGQQIKQARQQEEEMQRAKRQREEYQRDLSAAFSSPTATAFAKLQAKYPGQSGAFKDAWSTLSADQKDAQYLAGVQAYSALANGDVDAAKAMLDEQIAATANSGKPTQQLEQIKSALETDPARAQGALGFVLSATDPDRWNKMTEGLAKQELRAPTLAKARADAQKAAVEVLGAEAGIARTRAEISNISSQIGERSARLNLDARRLAQEFDLKQQELQATAAKNAKPSEASMKIINDAAVGASAASLAAQEAEALLKQIDGLQLPAGVKATVAEWSAKTFGTQDEATRFRQRMAALTNKQVIAALPPGVATEKDVLLASKGFPDSTSSPDILKSYLSGVAKIQKYTAAAEEAKADWIGEFGSLGRAKKSVDLAGVQVKPGMTYQDYAKEYALKTYNIASPVEGAATATATAPATALTQGAIPAPKSAQEYNALPLGAQYMGPDGRVRVKGGRP